MEHHFNVELATKIGLEESILVGYIHYWISKNKANNKHLYDGKYWTYNSVKAFKTMFPYIPERTLARKLKGLEEKGFILSKNYNENQYDRTLWYTLTDMGEALINGEDFPFVKMANGLCQNDKSICQNGEPIPVTIEPVTNTVTIEDKSNISSDILDSAKSTTLSHKRPTIQKVVVVEDTVKTTKTKEVSKGNDLEKNKKQAKSNLIKNRLLESVKNKYNKGDRTDTLIYDWVKSVVEMGKPISMQVIQSNIEYLNKQFPNKGADYERALGIATRNGWKDLEWAVKRIREDNVGNSVLDPSKAPRTGETKQQIDERHERVKNQMAENKAKFGSF